MIAAVSLMFWLCVNVSELFDEDWVISPGRSPGQWERAAPIVPRFKAACPKVKPGAICQAGPVTNGPELGSPTIPADAARGADALVWIGPFEVIGGEVCAWVGRFGIVLPRA